METYFGKLDPGLKDITVNNLIILLITVADQLAKHPGYQTAFPPEVPDPEKIRAVAAMLQQAKNEAMNKDTAKLALQDEKHLEGKLVVKAITNWAEIKASCYNDVAYLHGLGIPMKDVRKRAKPAVGPMAPPSVFEVRRAAESGGVLFKVGKVNAAAHYDIRFCLNDPTNEDSWSLPVTFLNTRNMRIDGLEPGKVYHFQIRVLEPTGFSAWSHTVKIMVV
jgi:hypothetical protein